MISIRSMLNKNILKEIKDKKNIALSFSGGTDSLCILFACLKLGIKPTLYTYKIKNIFSKDHDIAQAVAKDYNLNLVVGEILDDDISLLNDVKKMIKDGIKGKVSIQCMHGHYYIAPLVKEKQILNGSGIDGIYGVYKDIAIVGRNDKKKFDDKRNKHLANPNDDAMIYQTELYKKLGIKVIYPYRKNNILNYLMTLPYKKINSPKLKQIILNEFPEVKPYWRPRGSQQIIAGTRSLHEKLKNLYKIKRVDEIYKCII